MSATTASIHGSQGTVKSMHRDTGGEQRTQGILRSIRPNYYGPISFALSYKSASNIFCFDIFQKVSWLWAIPSRQAFSLGQEFQHSSHFYTPFSGLVNCNAFRFEYHDTLCITTFIFQTFLSVVHIKLHVFLKCVMAIFRRIWNHFVFLQSVLDKPFNFTIVTWIYIQHGDISCFIKYYHFSPRMYPF